ncbi:FusB/FusC family EF-G-binding protein [Paenibacillus tarimensis]
MKEPFIRNHHYNFIKKQIDYLQHAYRTVSDPKVVESVRYGTESNIMGLFPDADDIQQLLTGKIPTLQTAEDFQQYLLSLEPYMTAFPQVTATQIRKLFPKNKKLTIPDLKLDYRHITYLGWLDISANKIIIVYPFNGQILGIEGRFTPTGKKGACFLCNRHEETALVTAVTKARPAKSSPDYYKAVGNYMCMDSEACNKNITDVASLERFIHEVLG